MTSTVLIYDCFSGISGDMHLGALLDLGAPERELRAGLDRLPLAGEFELNVRRDQKQGISGTRATVRLTGEPGHHRNLTDIETLIRDAGYSRRVETRALSMFRLIAEAEAKIHDKPIDAVHFHEVGATDSIVDIVGAALALDLLDVERAFCRTLELGGGMVRCAHGMMPVPAPATAEILAGVPCRYDGVDQEATTPTGAAILKTVVEAFSMPDGFVSERIGYGIGQKDFEIPNVLRVMLGALEGDPAAPESELDVETNLEISTNIDDMPAEAFQPLMDRLLDAGAKDVYLTPITMKKARPAVRLSVLCAATDVGRLETLIFNHSSTIGVRMHPVTKHMLQRTERRLPTSLGEVRVKIVTRPDGGRRSKVEHDDVARIAAATDLDYLTVRERLQAEVSHLLDQGESG